MKHAPGNLFAALASCVALSLAPAAGAADTFSMRYGFAPGSAYDQSFKLALTTSIDRIACKGCSVSGISTIMGQPLRIIDLDGDGEPEVLVDLYTGGAHCCWATLFLRWDGHTYRSMQHLWGDPSYDLSDLDHLALIASDVVPQVSR